MSSVVISNKNIFNQRVVNIEQNKVHLPFNVSKEQVKKLSELLAKAQVTFLSEQDKLNISDLTYNGIAIKSNDRNFVNCRFTLSKAYVVTMKQSFITKVKNFYGRLVEVKAPERPVFSIGNETNLQAALAEATTEIDLSTINASLNLGLQANAPVQNAQVLANNPNGETIIENPVNLNNPQPINTPPVIDNSVNPVPIAQQQPQFTANQQPMMNNAYVNQGMAAPVQQEFAEQPKVKVKKLKGSVLAVPIVVVWLGAVFYGTMKLVTSILT